ncbi:PEP-CTERM sorting domain-containing protein [Janthinobacterium sp. BJB1]|uniref:PEPxxWA-CTERM sorting domain-containing protein n=1 Tax=Janthinobacterium sp. GW458P TaxID=1981504 RepID=UPI000A325464|nr:PEPxxWA-CTERM sorting domain-containing protein [Janthinobacterium sp. GW458P]MBE3027672.1 PEP-CTERM sorting domain-containing protein [Janthinobacterium sp. GW458P]PHV15014.1 PEP-CTERM sorting domain-containing protein [Janthinobacterium sp. BJB303]PJC96927.1 PEP-CTERM sorting domain-containing protein [Janthinobacterium sp. BJB1]
MKKLICLMALSATAWLSSAQAASVYSADHSGLGAIASPGQLSDTFNASAGAAVLNFELQGYLSLDGANNGYTDTFSLIVNGATLLTGSWDLGGGGVNVLYFNPNNAVVHAHATGYFGGGKASVEIPIALLGGSNTITYSYTGAAQGLGDEGWGINGVNVSAVPEPGTYAMLLAGLGLVGCMARRRAVKKTA